MNLINPSGRPEDGESRSLGNIPQVCRVGIEVGMMRQDKQESSQGHLDSLDTVLYSRQFRLYCMSGLALTRRHVHAASRGINHDAPGLLR